MDRDTEYVVEDGMIVPQRVAPASTMPRSDASEPFVPQGSPVLGPTPGPDDLSVPAGMAGPAVDAPDQQVPGEHVPATASPVTAPAHAAETPEQEVPRL